MTLPIYPIKTSRAMWCDCGEWSKEKIEKKKPLIGAFCDDCKSLIKEIILYDMIGHAPESEKKMHIDQVNHPSHYRSNGMEVIDVIEAFKLNFFEGNIIKYILRHGKKNGLEDLNKAKWYLERLIENEKNKH